MFRLVVALLIQLVVGSPAACSTPGSCEGSRASLMQRVKTVFHSPEAVTDSDESESNVGKLFESMRMFQQAATEEHAEHLTHNLAVVFQSAGTPEVARLANKILMLLKMQKDAILKAHNEDIDLLESIFKKFGRSKSELDTKISATIPLQNNVKSNRQDHLQCRDEESNHKSELDRAKANWLEAKDHLKTEQGDEMKAFNDHKAIVEQVDVNAHALSASERQDLKRTMTALRLAMEAASQAEVWESGNKSIWTHWSDTHGGQQEQCDSDQKDFEQSVCDLARTWETIDAHYEGEYVSHKADYESVNESVRTRELDRFVEWKWVERVTCVTKLLNETSRAQNGTVEKSSSNFSRCASVSVNTSELVIEYKPTPPQAETPHVSIRPCSAAFLSDEYGDLPSNARNAECSANCPVNVQTPAPTPPALVVVNPPETDRTYSSVWGKNAIGTGHARSMLDSAQAWSAEQNSVGQWMQIDLGEPKFVAGVVTQSRSTNDVHGRQKVTEFKVMYSVDGSAFTYQGTHEDAYTAPSNDKTTATFATPVSARYVRFVALKWNTHISMRAGVVLASGTKTQKYSYLGCFEQPGWTRPGGDVPSTIGGVEQCRRICGDRGFKLFGFECPHNTGKENEEVHCQCSQSVPAKKTADDQCSGAYSVNHCKGPFTASGLIGDYALGAGWRGSVYTV